MDIVTTSSTRTAAAPRPPAASPSLPAWSAGEPLPERLRRVLERLSGHDLSDVRVYPDSPLPARIGARAFALGSCIHLSRGAGDALEHEAWHVVQQKQGRVRTAGSARFDDPAFTGLGLNCEEALEAEADTMALLARHLVQRGGALPVAGPLRAAEVQQPVIQRQVTVLGVKISDPTSFQEEIKDQLNLTTANVTGFADIAADLLQEQLVFASWPDVKREILIREAGYQAADTMQELADKHGERASAAALRYRHALAAAQSTSSGTGRGGKVTKADADKLERQIYNQEGVIRWGYATFLTYKCRDREMFQWLQGTRTEDPLLMNCWEAVLYSLVKTGLVDKSYITWCNQQQKARSTDLPRLLNPSNLAASLLRNMDCFYWPAGLDCEMAHRNKRVPPAEDDTSSTIVIPRDKVIPKGRVLMFGLNEHVALSTGTLRNGKHGILELDEHTGTIKEGTIEALKNPYLKCMVVAPFPICPQGSVRIVQEDEDKTAQRRKLKLGITTEYQSKKDAVASLSQQKLDELEKQKASSSSAQEINERIQAEQKACEQELARLDAEANEKFENAFGKWLKEREESPNLEVITLEYQACDPYYGEVELP